MTIAPNGQSSILYIPENEARFFKYHIPAVRLTLSLGAAAVMTVGLGVMIAAFIRTDFVANSKTKNGPYGHKSGCRGYSGDNPHGKA